MENASLVWRLTSPSLVLSRSWKSADARQHELRPGAKRSAVSWSPVLPFERLEGLRVDLDEVGVV